MEIEAAARRHLLADNTVNGYLAGRAYAFKLKTLVTPHGHRALVLYRGNPWAQTERYEHAGAEFPTLVLDCWSDHSRDGDGEMLHPDRVQNAYALWRAAHNLIHNQRPGTIWGRSSSNPGVLINTCSLWAGPPHLDGEGHRTGIPVGEAAVVTAVYALNMATLTG